MEETDLSAFCVREDFLQVHLRDELCELSLRLLLVAQFLFDENSFDENFFYAPFQERVLLRLSEGFSAWFEEQRTGPIIPHSRDICSLNLAQSLFVLLPPSRLVFLCTQFVEQNTDCVYTWLYLSQIILSLGFSSDVLKIRIGVPRGTFPAIDLQMARIYLSVGDYSETLRRLKEISEGCVLPQHIDRFSDVATLAYRLVIELIHTPARPEGIPEIDEPFFESHLRRLFDVAVETLTSTATLFDSGLEDAESMERWGPRGTEVVRHLKELKASNRSTNLYLPQDVSRALVPLNTVSFVQRKWLSVLREHCKTIADNDVGPALLLVGLTSMQSVGTEIATALPWPSLYDYRFTNEVVAKAREYHLGVIILLRAIHTAYGTETARRFWIRCIRDAAGLSYELSIQSQRIWDELATAAKDDSLSEIIDSLLQEECVKEPMILFQICVRRMKYHEATEVLKQLLLDDVYEIALGFTLWDATVWSAWKRFHVQSILRVLHTNKKEFASEVLPLEVKKALCSMYEPDDINLAQIHGFLGQYSEGIELLKDIVGWEKLRALKTRVELLTANQMYDRAIEECNQALSHAVDWYKKEPGFDLLWSDDFESRVLYYKASVLNAEGNGKETIEICDYACRRRTDPRFTHLFRGIMKRWLTDDQFCRLVPQYARSFVFLLDNAECLLYGLDDHDFLLNEKFIYFA
jgi:hypothetical protein